MKKQMTLRLLMFMVAYAPLQTIAQQAQETTPPAYYGPGPWHMGAYDGGWHFWWMFPMVIFFFVVCGIMLMFARSAFGYGGPFRGDHGWHIRDRFSGDATRSALEILNERFARGEIQKEEYAEKKAALLSGTNHRDRAAA
jgi:putative membrane protein